MVKPFKIVCEDKGAAVVIEIVVRPALAATEDSVSRALVESSAYALTEFARRLNEENAPDA